MTNRKELGEESLIPYKEVLLTIAVVALVITLVVAFNKRNGNNFSREKVMSACTQLHIAFMEAQIRPEWYRETSNTLKVCGITVTEEDVTSRVCVANKLLNKQTFECNVHERKRYFATQNNLGIPK